MQNSNGIDNIVLMREVMPANPDGSPVSRDLREVFHLNGARPA